MCVGACWHISGESHPNIPRDQVRNAAKAQTLEHIFSVSGLLFASSAWQQSRRGTTLVAGQSIPVCPCGAKNKGSPHPRQLGRLERKLDKLQQWMFCNTGLKSLASAEALQAPCFPLPLISPAPTAKTSRVPRHLAARLNKLRQGMSLASSHI